MEHFALFVQVLSNSGTSVSAALRDSQQQLHDALKNRQLQVSLTPLKLQYVLLLICQPHAEHCFFCGVKPTRILGMGLDMVNQIIE